MSYPRLCCLLFSAATLGSLNGCVGRYDDFVGRDIREVVRQIDDEDHMIVWPRDEKIIFDNCSEIDFVTLVPKYPPDRAINIYSDSQCRVTRIEEEPRKGL